MAEEDFVELGFEGINAFATKYHDNLPFWKSEHSHPHLHRIAHPFDGPPPDSKYAKQNTGSQAASRDDLRSEGGRSRGGDAKSTRRDSGARFAADGSLRRGSDAVRNSHGGSVAYPPPPPPAAQARAYAPDPYRGRPPSHVGSYDTDLPSAPLPAGTRRLVPPDDSIILERQRFRSRSRSRSRDRHRGRPRRSSYSHSNRDKSRDRKGSKSGLASSVVGALAGGLAGNNISHGDTFTTLASAVIGAVGASKGYEKYEERKEKKTRRDDRRSESGDDSDSDHGRRRNGTRERRGGRSGRIYFKDDEAIPDRRSSR